MKKENIYKQLRENTETIDRPALKQGELAEIFKKEGNPLSQSVISKLESQQKEPPTTSPDVIKAYATHFNVTADYLLGIRNNAIADENIAMIGKVTGLSDNSIQLLKIWNEYKNNPEKFAVTYGVSDIDTLNLLLEDYYMLYTNLRKKKQTANYSIFHFIGNYIFSDLFRRKPDEPMKYEVETSNPEIGNPLEVLKVGDTVNGKAVLDLHQSESDNFEIYNALNADEKYHIHFRELIKTYNKDMIISIIDSIRERITKNETT